MLIGKIMTINMNIEDYKIENKDIIAFRAIYKSGIQSTRVERVYCAPNMRA